MLPPPPSRTWEPTYFFSLATPLSLSLSPLALLRLYLTLPYLAAPFLCMPFALFLPLPSVRSLPLSLSHIVVTICVSNRKHTEYTYTQEIDRKDQRHVDTKGRYFDKGLL